MGNFNPNRKDSRMRCLLQRSPDTAPPTSVDYQLLQLRTETGEVWGVAEAGDQGLRYSQPENRTWRAQGKPHKEAIPVGK